MRNNDISPCILKMGSRDPEDLLVMSFHIYNVREDQDFVKFKAVLPEPNGVKHIVMLNNVFKVQMSKYLNNLEMILKM